MQVVLKVKIVVTIVKHQVNIIFFVIYLTVQIRAPKSIFNLVTLELTRVSVLLQTRLRLAHLEHVWRFCEVIVVVVYPFPERLSPPTFETFYPVADLAVYRTLK